VSGWPVRTIGEVCEVIGGGTPDTKRAENYDGDIPWITVRDMNVDIIENTERNITKKGLQSSASNLIPAGNVIIATRVGLGKICKISVDSAINQDIKAVIPRDKKILNIDYLYWWFRSVAPVIVAEGRGATVLGVKLPFVKSLKIPLPPLVEQKRIVAFLDEAFAGIAQASDNATRNLENAKELPGVLLEKALAPQDDWQKTTLAEIAEFKNGLNFTRTSKGETIRIVGVKDFQNEYRIPTKDLEYVTIDGKLPPAYELRKNDILTVRSNGNKQLIGRCVIAGEVSEKTSHSGFTIRIRATSPKIHAEFLAYALKSRSTRARLVASGGGANISSLNQGALSSLPIAFPDVKTQVKIVENIHAMMDMCKQLQDARDRKAEQLDELKKSLLYQAFSGKLKSKEVEAA